jgi:hypothetical protein
MREVHSEVLRPTQRSPCLRCPRELEPKEDCAESCDRLRVCQAAAADISDRTHTHELVGESTAPMKQAAKTETVPAAKPPEKKEQTPKTKEIQETVRKVIDGYAAGHEFTFPDLVQDVSRSLGKTVTANVLGNWFYGSARPPGISCRKAGWDADLRIDADQRRRRPRPGACRSGAFSFQFFCCHNAANRGDDRPFSRSRHVAVYSSRHVSKYLKIFHVDFQRHFAQKQRGIKGKPLDSPVFSVVGGTGLEPATLGL